MTVRRRSRRPAAAPTLERRRPAARGARGAGPARRGARRVDQGAAAEARGAGGRPLRRSCPMPTFTRALAPSVCRALKIDPQPVLARLPQTRGAPARRVERAASTRRSASARRMSSRADWSTLRSPAVVVAWRVLGCSAAAVAAAGCRADALRRRRRAAPRPSDAGAAAGAAAVAAPARAERRRRRLPRRADAARRECRPLPARRPHGAPAAPIAGRGRRAPRRGRRRAGRRASSCFARARPILGRSDGRARRSVAAVAPGQRGRDREPRRRAAAARARSATPTANAAAASAASRSTSRPYDARQRRALRTEVADRTMTTHDLPRRCLHRAGRARQPRRSRQARVRWGARVVTVGGDAPVRVQSMTNTDTVDAIGTAIQVKELALAGSELVRITVNTPEAAAAVPLHPRAARPHGHRRAADRRLPLQRPSPADRLSRPAPRRCRSTASTRATSARATSATRQFAQMIEVGVRSTTSRCASASTGAASTRNCSRSMMDENAQRAEPWDAQAGHVRGADHLGDRVGAARRGDRPGRRPDHPVVQDVAACRT